MMLPLVEDHSVLAIINISMLYSNLCSIAHGSRAGARMCALTLWRDAHCMGSLAADRRRSGSGLTCSGHSSPMSSVGRWSTGSTSRATRRAFCTAGLSQQAGSGLA